MAEKGVRERYRGINPAVRQRLSHELSVIIEFGYADYFLLAYKTVAWSRSQGIRTTGRGSASDSIVAYALRLTDVDVIARNLPFARFVAPGKVLDIDLDFPHDRRDEVFRYLAAEYGKDNVAMCCTFHTFLAKSALRDVGKALALPADVLSWFARNISGFVRADKLQEAFAKQPELMPYTQMTERFQLLFDICRQIAGFPRHLGPHSSGVVISRFPLDQLAPVTPSARGVLPIVTLDKDDVEEVGAIKLDVLSLRILSAVENTVQAVRRTDTAFDYDQIPPNDPATYQLIQSGKAMGAFQLESPAQMALACSLSPTHFEDLVASVALIRPGPIRSHAVKRFVAARNGWQRVTVLHHTLGSILEKTYGCMVFQEQVVQTLAVLLGITDAEADTWRKRLAKMAKVDKLEELRAEFIARACARHRDFAPGAAGRLWEGLKAGRV